MKPFSFSSAQWGPIGWEINGMFASQHAGGHSQPRAR